MNEILSLISDYCKRHNFEEYESKLEIFCDGSGFFSPKDLYEPVYEFSDVDELIEILKG